MYEQDVNHALTPKTPEAIIPPSQDTDAVKLIIQALDQDTEDEFICVRSIN